MGHTTTRSGTPDVLVRTTAALFVVGGASAALLSAEVLRTDGARGAALLVAALAAAACGPLVLAVGPRTTTRGFGAAVLVAGTVLGVGTAVAPTLALALAAACLTVLVAIESTMFLRRRDAWAMVGLASTWQLVALVGVHHVPVLVCAALAVLWCGVAAAVDMLARQASTARVDALTGLADRRGWDAALERAIERSGRRGTPLSLVLVDIDHFKHVNDARGHAAGDDLLRATADAWRGALPPGAVLGRRGGDEFAVLLPGTTGGAAAVVAERLSGVAPTPASCGVAEHVVGETAAEVLRRTDAALYAAKAAGRGRTVLSERHRHHLVDDLADAIRHGGLRVELQPVVGLTSFQVGGVEALARWDHPRLGPVPPTEFVALAEDAGLIDELGAAVVRLACADAHELQERWGRAVALSVNVSGRELTAQGYADRLLATLHAARWPAGQFVLEVTESVVEASGPTSLRAIETLRAGGVRVAIDDFGTGWSSFSRLDELPADFLKLDRSFLPSLTTSSRRAAMVRALLALCDELGVLVVAEGVETPEQARLLEELGCPAAQGYHYGRPAPVDVLAAAPWDLRPDAVRHAPETGPAVGGPPSDPGVTNPGATGSGPSGAAPATSAPGGVRRRLRTRGSAGRAHDA
ncbi:bifunctional diguanylate cyclase/phosphodiesterase [Cellulomonas sp. B6]|uniref:putative bifunctional diguanylate cyclase/phosphodiesterase n=1 Tax=Cellulomonas sp. B6 TaxID=1295626 RepID=UPI00073C5EB4|nr:bifunctional diguanylate cyclase/phosphodiesterase [Cellulomonas sp. B6]KSW14054.1 hypothetical protein ATM99_02950 [Cellulomonas sp. B6]